MRLHRFYVAQPLGEDVVIDDVSIVKQWVKVFRYIPGDFVILFNGDGNDCRYTIHSISQKSCNLTRVEITHSCHVPKRTYLYFSIIKKANFELLVQKASEIGVTDIIPVISEHTEKKNLDARRLEIIAHEASEQSGRGDILTIHEAITFNAIPEDLVIRMIPSERVFAATLFGDSVEDLLKGTNVAARAKECAFLIGPEGGWSEEEETAIENHSFKRISLGAMTLRAETAGIVCSFLSRLI